MVRKPGQSKPIRVGIADKSPLMRAALKQIFSEDDRFLVVSASENSEGILEGIEPVPVDVAVVGWIIPPGFQWTVYLNGFQGTVAHDCGN